MLRDLAHNVLGVMLNGVKHPELAMVRDSSHMLAHQPFWPSHLGQ